MDADQSSSLHEERVREAIVAAGRRLHQRGLIAGAEGNVSVRLDTAWLLVTPAGRDKATLRSSDIVRVPISDAENRPRNDSGPARDARSSDNSRRASSELEMHRSVYVARPDVQAVIHAHPPVATGFAAAGLAIPFDILPEFPAAVGPMALVSYARPGTPALAEALKPWLAAHEVFLLANHGVTVVGATLDAALHRMESVEQGARSIFVAQLLGGARPLPPGEIQALAAARSATQITTMSSSDSLPFAILDQDRNR